MAGKFDYEKAAKAWSNRPQYADDEHPDDNPLLSKNKKKEQPVDAIPIKDKKKK